MERHIRNISCAAIAFAAVLFTACHDVIFYKIDNEVKLEDANIQGEIHDIVRFTNASGDYLYIDNGQIRYKPASSTNNDDWTKHMTGLQKLKYDYYDSEFDGVQIIKVACDEDNLYALGVEWETDDDEGENMPKAWVLYTSTGPGVQWKEFWRLNRGGTRINQRFMEYRGVISLFCTNTYNKANRKAFLKVSLPSEGDRYWPVSKIYSLAGEAAPAEYSNPKYLLSDSDASDLNRMNALTHDVAYFKGDYYFLNYNSDYAGIGTNETLTADATRLFYSKNNTLYVSSDGTNWTGSGMGTSGRIISMVMTSDYFIFGTARGGLYKVRNSAGVPVGGTVDFSTNADVALGSPYMTRAMYCMDPSKSELNAVIYATVDFVGSRGSTTGSTDDIGLWSYYPRRGNWNRE